MFDFISNNTGVSIILALILIVTLEITYGFIIDFVKAWKHQDREQD